MLSMKTENGVSELLLVASMPKVYAEEIAEYKSGSVPPLSGKILGRALARSYRLERYPNGVLPGKRRVAAYLLVVLLSFFFALLAVSGYLIIRDLPRLLGSQSSYENAESVISQAEPTVPAYAARRVLVETASVCNIIYEYDGKVLYYTRAADTVEHNISGDFTAVVNGISAAVSSRDGNGGTLFELQWSDGEYSFVLSGNMGAAELCRAANGIYGKE